MYRKTQSKHSLFNGNFNSCQIPAVSYWLKHIQVWFRMPYFMTMQISWKLRYNYNMYSITYLEWVVCSWGNHQGFRWETIHPRHSTVMSIPDLTLELFLLQIPKSYVTSSTSCHHYRVTIWNIQVKFCDLVFCVKCLLWRSIIKCP